MSAPVLATASRGRVLIDVDPATARDLAEAFSTAYATCEELEADRPGWFGDVVTIVIAAAQAEVQAGAGPEVVEVPVIAPGDRLTASRSRRGGWLTLVDGGAASC